MAVPLSLFVAIALIVNGGWVAKAIGAWLVGVGLNFLCLAVYAVRLSRPGRLSSELDGVDLTKEIRYFSIAQFWAAVPAARVGFRFFSSQT